MLIAVNYVVKSWEGFPTHRRHGWAHYPYDKRGKSDYRYEKIDCSTYIKRIVETLRPQGVYAPKNIKSTDERGPGKYIDQDYWNMY